jgi:hypothetical protein
MSYQLNTDVPKDKLYTVRPQRPKAVEEQPLDQSQDVVKQEPSLNNIQWVYQANTTQNATQVNPKGKVDNQAVSGAGRDVSIAMPGDEDLAVLSSSVSLGERGTVSGKGFQIVAHLGFNPLVMEETYRKYFRESRSHNLLLERFMSHVKFSAIKSLCSFLGVSLEEQTRIQSEVRDGALKEIDAKLSQDWAYSKALLEIVG